MNRLTIEEILRMHEIICERTGGDPGVRDRGLLESALESPFGSFGGADFYPTIEEKAARLGYALISNHAFVDGNKRIGIFALMLFLKINESPRALTDGDIISAALGTADGSMGYDELLGWVRAHGVKND